MTSGPDGEAPRYEVRRVGRDGAPAAVAIVREAAAHFAERGADIWTPDELREADFLAAADAQELVLGYTDARPAATMLLQAADPLYWPNAAPGSALYVHKVAVRRSFAGGGWLDRLIGYAAGEAREHGCRYLRLDTLEGPTLRSLYERLGFTALREPPLVVRGRPLIRMERRL